MKNFKRKHHQSLTENLKTHSKFQLIKAFFETLTENSKTVRHSFFILAYRTLFTLIFLLIGISRKVLTEENLCSESLLIFFKASVTYMQLAE